MSRPLLGCIADDYTGATDLGSMLARAGLRVIQCFGAAAESNDLVRAAKGALLANHGPVIGGKDLESAVYAAEELEETAKLFLLLRNQPTQFLTDQQLQQLQERFPS